MPFANVKFTSVPNREILKVMKSPRTTVQLMYAQLSNWSVYFIMSLASGLIAAQIYVAPYGKGGGDGSFEKPLASIIEAQKLITHQNVADSEPLHIFLRGGTYFLPSPLILNATNCFLNNLTTIEAAPEEK